MSHQGCRDVRTNASFLKELLAGLLDDLKIFCRHGNAVLDGKSLAIVALVCWGWSRNGTLENKTATAVKFIGRVFGVTTSVTRQGLMKALVSCGNELTDIVVRHFANRVQELKGYWTFLGRVNFGVDGSKFAAPRTKANQEVLSATNSKKDGKGKQTRRKKTSDQSKAETCQVLATVIWHMGSGLPFRWLVKGSSGSERNSLIEMLDLLPANARIIADAEYVGYHLWSTISQSRRTFLVRIGSNVRLLKNLGKLKFRDGFVSYWPDSARRLGQPPITLRLIKLHDGKKMIYLVTNELEMTDEEASALYRRRWGIEVFFRSVKQSCGRAKLRCHTPQNVLVELNWTLLGIWAAHFGASQVLRQQKTPLSRLSPVNVLRAFQTAVTAISLQARAAPNLREQLAQALIADESERTTSKRSRRYPRKKKHKPCGTPIIRQASKMQRQQAQNLLN